METSQRGMQECVKDKELKVTKLEFSTGTKCVSRYFKQKAEF